MGPTSSSQNSIPSLATLFAQGGRATRPHLERHGSARNNSWARIRRDRRQWGTHALVEETVSLKRLGLASSMRASRRAAAHDLREKGVDPHLCLLNCDADTAALNQRYRVGRSTCTSSRR